MGLIRVIKQYFITAKEAQQEYEISKKRQEELVKIIERLKNIDLNKPKDNNLEPYQPIIKNDESQKSSVCDSTKKNIEDSKETKKRQEKLVQTIENLKHIDLENKPSKKINVIDMIDIDKINRKQLKNTYKFIKKSIEVATTNGRTEELNKLKLLKQQVKKKLLEESDDLEKIRINLKLGNFSEIENYESYLMGLYSEMVQKSKTIKYDEKDRERKIKILTLLKLIEKIKNSKQINKQYIKKIA